MSAVRLYFDADAMQRAVIRSSKSFLEVRGAKIRAICDHPLMNASYLCLP